MAVVCFFGCHPAFAVKSKISGLLEILDCIGFNPVASLVAFCPSPEVDWSWDEPAQHWYLYQFSLKQVLDVPKLRWLSARRHAAVSAIPGS